MRKSRVLRIMRAGGVAISTKCNLSDPREAEIIGMNGVDCVWIDLEHVPNSITSVEDFVRAAKIYDCDVITRIERGAYSNVIRPLEADSTGIMVPHLMSLADAKEVVYYSKYHPVGRRPIDGGNADGGYASVDNFEYIKTANAERMVIVQIEDPEPMKEIEEICALPGIDMLFFGPSDYSQGIGRPFEHDHPEVLAARRKMAEVAIKHGKFAGTVGSIGNFSELVGEGFRFINIGADVIAYHNYNRNNMNAVNEKLTELGIKKII